MRNGFCIRDSSLPLGMQKALRTDYESFFLLQNLMLVGQALGLGGWVHSSISAPWVLQRDEAKAELALGFRVMIPDKHHAHWPPVPGVAAESGRYRRGARGLRRCTWD